MYVCVIFKQTMELIKKNRGFLSIKTLRIGFEKNLRASHHRLQDRRRMAERCKILCAADRDQWLQKKQQTYSVWCVYMEKNLIWNEGLMMINVHLTLWNVFFVDIYMDKSWNVHLPWPPLMGSCCLVNPSRCPCFHGKLLINRYLIFRQSHMS